MGFDRIRIKENAKTHYDLNKWNNVLVAFISSIIMGAVSGMTSGISNFSSDSDDSAGLVITIYIVNIVLSIFVTNIMAMGTATWYQKAIHRDNLDMGAMFDPFRVNYMDNVLAMFLKNLYIGLWSLLFIIPGIVAVYRYRFALYNLCEDPDMGIMDAIRLSKEQTMGYKGDLFLLDLSFLGWLLLSACTAGLLGIWLSPYMAQTDIAYFQAIKQAKGMGTLPGQSGPEADDVFRTDDRFSGPGF